jgi:hypothetical protein
MALPTAIVRHETNSDRERERDAAMSLSFPLTTMEQCLYWQDRPAYPWSWFARLKFSGCLDRTAFEAALAAVLARHPLLTAKVAVVGRQQLSWFPVDDPEPMIGWEAGPLGDTLPPAAHLDLHREIGIRFHVRTDATASELTIQFHHTCCDGIGGCMFIEDLLLAYALACGDPPDQLKLRPLDPGKLRGRGTFGLTFPTLLKMAPQQLVGVLRGRHFLTRRPVPLVPHRPCPNDDIPPKGYPATLHHVFDEESTIRGRRTAKHLGVTLNDLLVRDLFLALAEWRSRQNIGDDGHWLRMVIPTNLRTPGDRLLSAANMIGNVFLDRRGPDFTDASRLLQSIHKEMALVKRWRLGLAFNFLANIYRWLPGGLKRKIRADECLMSCMLTNLGEPFAHLPVSGRDGRVVAGNVTLENVDFIAPTAPFGCVTVGVITYARRLGLTLHYDPRPLSEGQATDLLAAYVRRIQTSMAELC